MLIIKDSENTHKAVAYIRVSSQRQADEYGEYMGSQSVLFVPTHCSCVQAEGPPLILITR